MKFKTGQNLKPHRTTPSGQVIFTDGQTDCTPNQTTCVAYGYTWNSQTNICSAFPALDSKSLLVSTLSLGNSVAGVRNEVKAGSYHNEINGSNNIIDEAVQNGLITGSGNDISRGLNNTTISGLEGKVLRQGEKMQGAGVFNFSEPYRLSGFAQCSTIQFTGVTIGAVPVPMKINGIGDLVLQNNSVIGFDIKMLSLNKTNGSYVYYKHEGAIHVDNSFLATICIDTQAIICQKGEGEDAPCLTSISLVQAKTADDVQMVVTGCSDQELLHHAVMNLHETRTNTYI
jgi:hypothetical protein